MERQKRLAIVALLCTMFFWGSAPVFLRTQALALSFENSLALRYLLLTVINLAGLMILGTWRIRREHWGRFLILGLAGMAGYNWFVNAGFALVPAGAGTIVTMVQPLMIAVLAWALLSEKLSSLIVLAVAIASLGAVVLFWHDLTSVAGSAVSPRGIVYLLICCACWSVYTVAAKPLLLAYDSFTVTAVTMIIAAPVLVGAASQSLADVALRLDGRQWAEIFYLMIPNGVLGTFLWNYGSRRLPAAATGSFLYLIPVIAVACGALILDEPVTFNIIAGGLLMLAGVAVAQFGPHLRKTQLEPGTG